ncbi:glycosyl transferase family 2 [Siccirubricoccus deserti]|uniref:Glycosyltransferase n=1 Tax=Siccirubricoccus deserti TaxID=2013562 RepID=A0A9X0QVW6_9PROT|nr:glycosyltransferase [Siccirubricoccus deserti]MBC4014445.1 glycosyltransferase [Siccirubricoccus deserti]GGC32818.1 glycosyl transferase family 2 [Siccirubricoccus deserti]
MSFALAVAFAACLAWAVLLLGRGFFWLARDDDRDAPLLPEPAQWPAVAAVVPARDEAGTIAETVRSLLAQDYPGDLRLVVVDDRSTDGTGALALAAAAGDPRLMVVRGEARPAGWTGKLWALQQGLAAVGPEAGYLLFTDADIRHAPDSLRRLVQRATGASPHLVLVSLMARLRCASPAERWLIPAFIFFFQMLYPFRWARDPAARTAAAAGGCVLLDRAAFDRAGGLAPIRGALIDDCALAARMKAVGPIWVGLTERVESLRPYAGAGPIRRMVARTAYAQLGYRPEALLGMLLALALVFLAPPVLALLASGAAQALGVLAWMAMALGFAPTLRRFGLSPLRGLALPGIALAYMAFTLDSALAEWRGQGGMWKGEAGPRADRATGPH